MRVCARVRERVLRVCASNLHGARALQLLCIICTPWHQTHTQLVRVPHCNSHFSYAFCTDLPLDPTQVASQIEQTMFHKHGDHSNRSYKMQYRSLLFNLKHNPDLCISVLSGALPVDKLCTMSSFEMAPAALQQEREKILERDTKAIEVDDRDLEGTRYTAGQWVDRHEVKKYEV